MHAQIGCCRRIARKHASSEQTIEAYRVSHGAAAERKEGQCASTFSVDRTHWIFPSAYRRLAIRAKRALSCPPTFSFVLNRVLGIRVYRLPRMRLARVCSNLACQGWKGEASETFASAPRRCPSLNFIAGGGESAGARETKPRRSSKSQSAPNTGCRNCRACRRSKRLRLRRAFGILSSGAVRAPSCRAMRA